MCGTCPPGHFSGALLASPFNTPCRFYGSTIDKALQKGAITGLAYLLAPASIIHSWVEVYYNGRWLNLEGFILDTAYLNSLQQRFASVTSSAGSKCMWCATG